MSDASGSSSSWSASSISESLWSGTGGWEVGDSGELAMVVMLVSF